MPIANFTTEGKIITHSALSNRSCGILSGMFRISSKTLPAFSRRSVSFVSFSSLERAGSEQRANAIKRDITFRMILILLDIHRVEPGQDLYMIGLRKSWRNAGLCVVCEVFPCKWNA